MGRYISLSSQFPSIASEWDYEKNGELTPDQVTPGSHLNVFWKCPVCHMSYRKRISNRTAPSKRIAESNKCPICLGRVIIPGYNSLKAMFPTIVENEWDYQLNTQDPDSIAPHSNKKYHWICKNGHKYESSINNKTSGNGGNCPYCSHQKLSSEFSLASVNPTLSEEWDYQANGKRTPETVFANSNSYAHWVCSRCGHKWKAKITNRSNGRGCPECAKGTHSSFPEQALYYIVKSVFPDAVNGYKFDGKVEVDVFIPSINIAIEYDGEWFHSKEKRIEYDVKKDKFLQNRGIEIIRMRESNCLPNNDGICKILSFKYSGNFKDYSTSLQVLIDSLAKRFHKISTKVDVCSLKPLLGHIYHNIPYEESFAYLQEQLINSGSKAIALWDESANGKLKPENVRPMSEQTVNWICPTNPYHKWLNTVKSVSLGYGCSRCSKTHHYTTEEWIIAAKAKHGNKYDYSQTHYINSKTPVTIICPKHGPFEQVPTEHLSGKGCKYCAGQAFHKADSLSEAAPNLIKEWDFEKNRNEFNAFPETVSIHGNTKYWWKCDQGKNHSYLATIKKRIEGLKCAVCHGKQLSYDTSVEYLFPELAKEWHPSNSVKLSEVSKGSETKILWKCVNQGHPPYWASVYNRTHLHSGCPLCGRERTISAHKK